MPSVWKGSLMIPRQLADIVVGTHNGANVFLRDVARIVDTVEERAQETYNNGVQGAMIVVQKQSGANSVEISRKVEEALPRLQKNLPSDVKAGVIVDTSDNILNTIDSLAETVMYALLFVVIVVFLFLGRWRATLIICITIPLSLIASFIYLAITGNTINIISLSSLSIAIGMVVDDAIVVLENVTTHIERGSDPKQAAVHGTNEVAISVIASTLTMIAVFFPLTMVSGMSGVLFKQFGLDDVCHHVCVYRGGSVTDPDALFAITSFAEAPVEDVQALLYSDRESVGRTRYRLCENAELGSSSSSGCDCGMYCFLRCQLAVCERNRYGVLPCTG